MFVLGIYVLAPLTVLWWIVSKMFGRSIARTTIFFIVMGILFFSLSFLLGLAISYTYEPRSYWTGIEQAMNFDFFESTAFSKDESLLWMLMIPYLAMINFTMIIFKIVVYHFTWGFFIAFLPTAYSAMNYIESAIMMRKMRDPSWGF